MSLPKFLIISILLIITSKVQSTEKEKLNHFMVGFGLSNVRDLYLSPLDYTGWNIKLLNQQSRQTTWFDNKFYKQQNIDLIFSASQSPSKNTFCYFLKLHYNIGGHYSLYDNSKFSFRIGALGNINVGGLYNNRNGNNPATARGYITLTPSAMLIYNASSTIAMRLQTNMDVFGIYFQPQYGESYYELSLGNTKGIINPIYLGNFRAYQILYTVDIPIKNNYIILGLSCDWLQTRVHSVNTHNYDYTFMIGFPLSKF